MAEEAVYTVGGESNKRKYEDPPPPAAAPPRRSSGFSSTPDSAAPPSSYNTVPPPMNDFELAKQKAQEIAARLLSDADPLKRARVENEGGSYAIDYSTPKPMGSGYGAQYQVPSSGYSTTSKTIEIPNGRVGLIIGRGGETIKQLQLESGAKIQVTRDMDSDRNSATRGVDLTGTPDQIATAEQLINDAIAEADAGVSGPGSRRYSGQSSGSEQISIKVANNKVGLVIGKGGETIKGMQASTGARIQVIPLHLPPGDTSIERTVQIDGTSEQIEAARQLVEEATSENRVRNPSISSSYPQQGYQQPGYGYPQPGPYSGYPSQQGSNPPDVSSGYNYGQPPAYSQGQAYSQDAYAAYYAQQQQGYNTANYGNVANPTSEGPANPSYSEAGENQSQATSDQSGYGVPAPVGYGMPQPQYGGYGQYQAQAYDGSYGGGYSQPAQAQTSDAAAPQSGQAGGPPRPHPQADMI